MLNVMCDKSIVNIPRGSPTAMKSIMSDTPVTNSVLTMGMFVMFVIIVFIGLRRKPWMPIAAAVPITVEMSAESTPTMRVVRRAAMSCASETISAYHLSENPPQLPRDFELLNDITISTTMGA